MLPVQGKNPPKPTPEIGEEGVRSPQIRRRLIPLSPTGLGLVHPAGLKLVALLRSCSVAGSGEGGRKLAWPLALPLRYSSVQSNAVKHSKSCRGTRTLWVPPLPMLSRVLYPEDMRNFVPQQSTLGGIWEPNNAAGLHI